MYLLVGSVMRKSTSMYARLFLMLCTFTMLLGVESLANSEPLDCAPPIFTNYPAASVNKNHCSAFRFDFDAIDDGNSPAADPVTFTTSIGTINPTTGQLSVPTHPACGTTAVVVTATNSCGASTDYSFEIVWTNFLPTISNAPRQPLYQAAGKLWSFDLNSVDADPCDPAVWSVHPLDPVVNTPTISSTGFIKWLPDVSEKGGTKSFQVTVTDVCGGTVQDTLIAGVYDIEPTAFSISRSFSEGVGKIAEVSIIKDAGESNLGGFNFAISFDNSGLSFLRAVPGSVLGATECNWEYFTYSYQPSANGCISGCNQALIKIVAVADVTPINGSANCNLIPNGSEVAKLRFYITNDRQYEWSFFPIRFAWLDCLDNSAGNVHGDTAWISRQVFEFESSDEFPYSGYEITDTTCHTELSYGGACRECGGIPGSAGVRDIMFRNGGIDLNSTEFHAIGDINLNGIAYEIADAALLAKYFTDGLAAFGANPPEQVRQSDANQDRIVLTPADLVYLLRVIVGDALPFPKLQPYATTAMVEALGGKISFHSNDSIAAAFLSFAVTGDVTVSNRSQLRLDYAETDGKLRMLLWPGFDNMNGSLAAGLNEIVDVDGAVLESVILSDYKGNLMQVEIDRHVLPSHFALAQNYPNPFNPVTRINLELPQATDWTLEIFNVSGQQIENFSGHGVGIVTVEWNATNQPSGVYFYKLVTNGFTATKKMVLLK